MSIVACSVEKCEKPIFVKKSALCQSHYNRLNYAGTVEIDVTPANCVNCGRPNPPKLANGPAPSYCSSACRSIIAQRRRIESGKYLAELERRRQINASKPKPVHTCLQCGSGWTSTHRKSKFCSSKCLNRYTDLNNPLRCSEQDCDRGREG